MEKVQTALVVITWCSDSRRPFCTAGSVGGRAVLSVKREHREASNGRMSKEAEHLWGLHGNSGKVA